MTDRGKSTPENVAGSSSRAVRASIRRFDWMFGGVRQRDPRPAGKVDVVAIVVFIDGKVEIRSPKGSNAVSVSSHPDPVE